MSGRIRKSAQPAAPRLAVIDPGGVGGEGLAERIAAGFPAAERLFVGSKATGAGLSPAEFQTHASSAAMRSVRFVAGRMGLDALAEAGFTPAVDIVLAPVADPVRRSLALFADAHHQPLHPLHDLAAQGPLEEFLRSGLEANAQCRLLCGHPSFAGARDRLAAEGLPVHGDSTELFLALLTERTALEVAPAVPIARAPAARLAELLDSSLFAEVLSRDREDRLLSMWARQAWRDLLDRRFPIACAPAA